MDWSSAWDGRGEAEIPHLTSLKILPKRLGTIDVGNPVEMPALHATLSFLLMCYLLNPSRHQCASAPKSQPTAAIPLLGFDFLSGLLLVRYSAQIGRPTWEEGELLCAELCASPLGSDNSTAIPAIGFDVGFLLISHSLKLRASHDDWSCPWI